MMNNVYINMNTILKMEFPLNKWIICIPLVVNISYQYDLSMEPNKKKRWWDCSIVVIVQFNC